jgi:predicted acylesterase/phospholipase RssA
VHAPKRCLVQTVFLSPLRVLKETPVPLVVVVVFASVAFVWFPISLYRQSRWSILTLYLLILVCIALFGGLLRLVAMEFPQKMKTFVLVLIAAVTAAILLSGWLIVGTSNVAADLLAMAAAAILAILGVPTTRRRARAWLASREPESPLTLGAMLWVCGAFLGAAWLCLSAVDWVAGWGRAVIPAQQVNRAGATTQWAQVRVGLALSGGGYRAALFHAGVLDAFGQLGIPVRVISSVSGGSIIGAYYARGGAPADFLAAVGRRRFNLKRRLLRSDNALHLLASARLPTMFGEPHRFLVLDGYSRTDVQADLLDDVLLQGVKHREGSVDGRPELMLCATDLSESAMVGITPRGTVYRPIRTPLERLDFANPVRVTVGKTFPPAFVPDDVLRLPGEQRLSSLVAASGAFPGAFEAYSVNAPGKYVRELSDLTDRVTNALLLVDGGVVDNYGIVLLAAARTLARAAAQSKAHSAVIRGASKPHPLAEWNVDLAVVSDGSSFAMRDRPHGGPLEELSSVLETIYSLSAWPEMFTAAAADQVPPLIFLSPRTLTTVPTIYDTKQEYLPFGAVTEELQKFRKDRYFLPALELTEMDPDTLGFIVEQMQPMQRNRARELFSTLVARGVIRADGWHGALQPYGDLPTPERKLWDLVNLEIHERMRVFVGTSTLNDQIAPAAAHSIYLLGKYLTLLNKPSLLCHLQRARDLKALPEGMEWQARQCRVLRR